MKFKKSIVKYSGNTKKNAELNNLVKSVFKGKSHKVKRKRTKRRKTGKTSIRRKRSRKGKKNKNWIRL